MFLKVFLKSGLAPNLVFLGYSTNEQKKKEKSLSCYGFRLILQNFFFMLYYCALPKNSGRKLARNYSICVLIVGSICLFYALFSAAGRIVGGAISLPLSVYTVMPERIFELNSAKSTNPFR